MGKRKVQRKSKASRPKQHPILSTVGGRPRGDHGVKKQRQASSQVATSLTWLPAVLRFAISGVLLLAVFYTVLKPAPFCLAVQTTSRAVKAMLPYATSPLAAICTLMTTAVFAACVENLKQNANETRATGGHHAARQALTTLFKMVFYNGGSIFLASVLFTFTNSTFFQDFWASRFEIIGCDLSIAKAFGACLVFIGFISLLEEAFESAEPHHGHLIKQMQMLALGVGKAVMVLLKTALYMTVLPLCVIFLLSSVAATYVWGSQAGIGEVVGPWVADFRIGSLLAATLTCFCFFALLMEGRYVLKSKTTSEPIMQTDNMTRSAATAFTSKSPKPAHHHALEQKLQPLEQKTTEVADKITSMVERNLTTLSPLKKIESTGSSTIKDNSSNTLPSTLPDNDDKKAALVANSKAQGPSAKAHHTAKSTVDEFDAYLSLVRALLKRGMGEAPTVQLEIANSFSRQFKAVPKWMLTFAAAQNQGCSPLAGLETFKSFLNGNKHAKADCLPSSSNSVMMKNMALLLRTIMAATVEQELRQFGARDRLMAQDILRMTPQPGMPKYLREVPQWQLTALRQKLEI